MFNLLVLKDAVRVMMNVSVACVWNLVRGGGEFQTPTELASGAYTIQGISAMANSVVMQPPG